MAPKSYASYEEMDQGTLRAACAAQGIKITHAGGKFKTQKELGEELKSLDLQKEKGV